MTNNNKEMTNDKKIMAIPRLVADGAGAAFLLAVTLFFVLESDLVVSLTKAHPYAMGFVKFGILASYGECLKTRITTGRWIPAKLLPRAVIWGVFGMWISAAFSFFAIGFGAMAAGGLWPETPGPLWMSVWMNFLGGFGFFMMFAHYWCDTMLVEGFVWPWALFDRPETRHWGKIVLLTLVLFWIPVHALVFCLPPHWRILCAAYLGIVLGLILSAAVQRK